METLAIDNAMNAVTHVEYRGNNVGRFLAAAAAAGYGPGGWAGYRQWASVGRQVRKGEHGTTGIKVVSVPDRKGGGTRTVPSSFRVFHFDQTEPITAE